jgi:hypothetical protein
MRLIPWVKCDLLSLQLRDQLLGAINRYLIAYRSSYPTISLNRRVDLDAFFTPFFTFPRRFSSL